MITGDFAYAGTVSHGTLREADLVPAFLGMLDLLDAEEASFIRATYGEVIAYVIAGHDLEGDESEVVQWLMDDLFRALDGCAPEGYYFGAIEGDGSDFGFWRTDD